jgi:hypothetical protein
MLLMPPPPEYIDFFVAQEYPFFWGHCPVNKIYVLQ